MAYAQNNINPHARANIVPAPTTAPKTYVIMILKFFIYAQPNALNNLSKSQYDANKIIRMGVPKNPIPNPISARLKNRKMNFGAGFWAGLFLSFAVSPPTAPLSTPAMSAFVT